MMRTISAGERIRKGIAFIPWDETKEAKKNVDVNAWTHFYHKPYETDWGEARKKAVIRKWALNEDLHDDNEG